MTIKPTWIIEPGIQSWDNDYSIVEYLKQQNIPYHEIQYIPFAQPGDIVLPEIDGPVIFRGSLNFASYLLRASKYYPLLFEDLKTFDCSNYYPLFTDVKRYGVPTALLNAQYMMMPVGSLIAQKFFIFDTFYKGRSDEQKIFIRPNSGQKSFAGQIVSKDEFENFVKFIQENLGCSPNELVLVSKYEKIRTEYRAVIVDNKLVSVSEYSPNKTLITKETRLTHFIEDQLFSYNELPSAYTMDISEQPDYMYNIIEINSLNCAGWYDNDIPKVVEASNKLAVKQWKDTHEN